MCKSYEGFKMKQELVLIQKHSHCGFDLCPKRLKYLANPQLLDKIFTNQNQRFENIKKFRRTVFLDEEDIMITTKCVSCNQKLLLNIKSRICSKCRRLI
jgi:hypothetical protein